MVVPGEFRLHPPCRGVVNLDRWKFRAPVARGCQWLQVPPLPLLHWCWPGRCQGVAQQHLVPRAQHCCAAQCLPRAPTPPPHQGAWGQNPPKPNSATAPKFPCPTGTPFPPNNPPPNQPGVPALLRCPSPRRNAMPPGGAATAPPKGPRPPAPQQFWGCAWNGGRPPEFSACRAGRARPAGAPLPPPRQGRLANARPARGGRPAMPPNVLGCTRAALVRSKAVHPSVAKMRHSVGRGALALCWGPPVRPRQRTCLRPAWPPPTWRAAWGRRLPPRCRPGCLFGCTSRPFGRKFEKSLPPPAGWPPGVRGHAAPEMPSPPTALCPPPPPRPNPPCARTSGIGLVGACPRACPPMAPRLGGNENDVGTNTARLPPAHPPCASAPCVQPPKRTAPPPARWGCALATGPGGPTTGLKPGGPTTERMPPRSCGQTPSKRYTANAVSGPRAFRARRTIGGPAKSRGGAPPPRWRWPCSVRGGPFQSKFYIALTR